MKKIYMMVTLDAMVKSGVKPEEINKMLDGYSMKSVKDVKYFVKTL